MQRLMQRLCFVVVCGWISGLAACGGGSSERADASATSSAAAGDPSIPGDNNADNPNGADNAGNGGNGGSDSTPANADAFQQAMSTGNASVISTASMLAATQTQLNAINTTYTSVRQAMLGLDANNNGTANTPTGMDWDPTRNSMRFSVLDSSRNQIVLTSNWRYLDSAAGTGVTLGVAGQTLQTQARYTAFVANPLAIRGNAAMDQYMKNVVGWLSARSQAADFKVVTAHLPGSNATSYKHEAAVRSWFATNYPQVTINGQQPSKLTTDDTCDGDKLNTCLQNADLLVIGRQLGTTGSLTEAYPSAYDGSTIMNAVSAAQARGVPVLYLHHHYETNDLSNRLLAYFGLAATSNYWGQEGLKGYGAGNLPETSTVSAEALALLQRLDSGNFSTTWSGCITVVKRTRCEVDSSNTGDAAFTNEFYKPAMAIRARLRALDESGVKIFSEPGYSIEKMLVLLGDKYRQAVSYPMKKETAGVQFFRAYFSDLTTYLNRPSQVVATNLGNFSNLFAANLATISKTVSFNAPTSGTKEVMTGLYVLPGRAVTVTRSDNSASVVTLGVNMLRDTSRSYDNYDRPITIASPRLTIAPGKSVTISSPFGGPLYLFATSATGSPSVQVQVSGVITHPVLRDPNDPVQVAAFKDDIATTPTNWVGLLTDSLTVHSHLTKFRSTISQYGGDIGKLVSDINTYMIKDTYEFGGFNSPTPGALSLAPTVAAFCSSAGWDCTGSQHLRNVMQHVIVDYYSLCGDGCSGNPYDQSFALNPLGWAETHEIGHNLQVSRLKIYGGISAEVSNNIFPMHKMTMYNMANPSAPLPKNLFIEDAATQKVFNVIKASLSTANPSAAVTAAVWTDTSYNANSGARVAFYRQLVEFARHYNPSALSDGWSLYTLMNLLDRNMTASFSNWNSSIASTLGFGTYSAYPTSMNGNDFMVIATSRIIGRDMRPVFTMWGITFSAAASAQVDAYSLAAAENLVFPMADFSQYGAGIGAPVTMSTSAVYPTGY